MDLDRGEEFEIEIKPDCTIAFTQTHILEIQTLLGLIDEYGLPNEEDEQNDDLPSIPSVQFGSKEKAQGETKNKNIDSGTRVYHRAFGNGIVIECLGNRITIMFDNGTKKIFDLTVCINSKVLTIF